MEFRRRDYEAERNSYMLPRSPADRHPLSTSSSMCSPCFRQSAPDRSENGGFLDPLGGIESADSGADIRDSFSARVGSQAPASDWNSFKRFLMQRFPVSKTISLSSMSDIVIKRIKETDESSKVGLENGDGMDEKANNLIDRKDYIFKLRDLKDEINCAWIADDRAGALKLSVKVAKLLMDTTCPQFYPTLFVLATEVMDKLGEMVWNRIKQKAFVSEDGAFVGSWAGDFQASEVCPAAKETCYNWFCKIGAIRELLPRIYLELAILPCWRFLTDQPMQNMERLFMMSRGIADPLASAYCRLYMVHCSRKFVSSDVGNLVLCLNDIKLVFKQFLSRTVTPSDPSYDKKTLLVSLIEPTVEYIIKCLFENVGEKEASSILMKIAFPKSGVDQLSHPQCISVVLHHLLNELPSAIICMNAVNILCVIKYSNDTSFDQCLNYRLLGLRICESTCKPESENIFLNDVKQIIEQCEGLHKYLKVLEAFFDIIIQNQRESYVNAILEDVLKRAAGREVTHDESENLQSILIKLLSKFGSIDSIFALSHFFEVFNLLQVQEQAGVCMHLLEIATRKNSLNNPEEIRQLFQIARSLYDDVDFLGLEYVGNQPLVRRIVHFVHMVDHEDFDLHLMFLIDCRAAFSNLNGIKENVVHLCNHLMVKALLNGNKGPAFLKSCITFSEVTIPSVDSQAKQLDLYVATAEVALLGGFVCHANGLLSSAISCLENQDFSDGSCKYVDSLVSSLQKLCSLLVMVPGDFDRGGTKFPNIILSIVYSASWIRPRMKIKLLCAIILLSAALSQDNLPYRPCYMDKMTNDHLFFGDTNYGDQLVALSSSILPRLLHYIEDEPSKDFRGAMALDACHCIVSSFAVSQEMIDICRRLTLVAKSCLSSDDSYLQATIKYFGQRFPDVPNFHPTSGKADCYS